LNHRPRETAVEAFEQIAKVSLEAEGFAVTTNFRLASERESEPEQVQINLPDNAPSR
jgi:hypothetical protein